MNPFVVISACSGSGKSTLLDELTRPKIGVVERADFVLNVLTSSMRRFN